MSWRTDPPRLVDDPTVPPDDPARVAVELIIPKTSDALDRSAAVVSARLAAWGLLRACVLCGTEHTRATPITRTIDFALVWDERHPACRRVLAPGHWLCTPCYEGTVTLWP